MTERVCDLLKLNVSAGLGRRLAAAGVKQDAKDPTVFIILAKADVVEALKLAETLSFLAKEMLHLNMHFRPERISVCW